MERNYTLNRDDALLLIIDIQDKLANVMEEKDRVMKNTKILIECAKTMDFPILVTEQYPKGLGPTSMELMEKLDQEKDFFFAKNSFNAYIDAIRDKFKELGRKQIIVCGMETHICVLQTTRDLSADGFEVFVAEDAVCSRAKENKENGLYMMDRFGALISNTESIMYDLMKISGTPEFKTLSKLIK